MTEIPLAGSGGLRLCLCLWGEDRDEGVPVLILHGYLEQGAAWEAVALRLGRRVIAPDHRGHGRSGHVGRGGFYHFWDYVADVDAVVEWAGGRVDLCGHSMGGTIACLYAGTRPEAVRRLALVEGLGPPSLVPLALGRARAFLRHRREPPTHPPLADLDEAIARMGRGNPQIDPDLLRRLAARNTRPLPGGGLTWRWDPLHRATNPQPFDPAQFRIWLEAIEAPTLHLTGGRSPFRVADLEERMGWVRDLRHEVIPEAGHLVHHDAPERLASRLAAWFAEGAG